MQERNPLLLTLNASPRIGPKTFQVLAEAFEDDFEKYWDAPKSILKNILPAEVLKKFIEARETYLPEKELHKLDNIKAKYTTIYDKVYPEALKEIYNPPPVLYYRGEINILKSSALAVVGSRKFTGYGKKIGYKLAYELAQSGLTIVSGLALGLDSIVQRAALDASGLTIGVLACGIDQIYPAQNRELASKILSSGGLIISEQPPGTPPLKQNFPARNRIISGLALGTLVVEAAESSGSLITAACTLEQNREVFAVPGNVDSPASLGTNKLIKMGAYLVSETDDILKVLNLQKINQPKKALKLDENELILVEMLKEGSKHIDKLAQNSKLDIVLVSQTLTLLELKGAVCHLGGGVYQLNIL